MVMPVTTDNWPVPSDVRVLRDAIERTPASGEALPVPPPTARSDAMAEDTEPVPEIDAKALEQAVDDIARKVRNMQRSLRFSVDEVSGRTIITVIDKETNEVIRQIPPEEVLAIAEHIDTASGLFLNAAV